MNNIFEMTGNNSGERYMLVDISNHMYRSRFGAMKAKGVDVNEYALHLGITALNKLYREIQPTKIVAAIDYGSWRKQVFPMYKARRHEARERDESYEAFKECIKEFKLLIKEYSSIICLERKDVEADDWIGRWVQTHTQDDHIIVSSDGDFHQLHASNVSQFNPVSKQWIDVPNPSYALFLKCIRGETAATSDNIPSAYPGIREKKLATAFDGDTFVMETIMQHEMPDISQLDANGDFVMTTTRALYERNKSLMDLSKQPSHIVELMDETINTAHEDVGSFDWFQVMRYLGKNNLVRVSDNIDTYTKMLTL